MPTQRTIQTDHGPVQLGTFQEILTYPGRYLNDHCLIHHDHQWHFFGIIADALPPDQLGRPARHEIALAHATADHLTGPWQHQPEVLERSGTWPEITAVVAPYVIAHHNTFYLFYTALDQQTTQRICLATSPDLFHWTRNPANPIIVPSLSWSRWPDFGLDQPDQGSFGGCRDPHVIQLPDGRFVAYWSSRLQPHLGPNLVCIAASISADLTRWQEVGPVLTIPAWHCPLTMEAESSCVIYKDQRYWLFFKHGWWTNYVASDTPFNFPADQVARLGYSHAAEIFRHQNQWYITHCKTNPDDYPQAHSDCSRGLFLGRLHWPAGACPQLL